MTQKLIDFLQKAVEQKHATDAGTRAHSVMQHIVIDKAGNFGDDGVVAEILKHPELVRFFSCSAKTEVPIAGLVNGQFISRRLDRMLIDDENKVIDFIDYKTDVNKQEFIDKYKYQLKEYAELLRSAYPGYKINGYILWLRDWMIDKII